MLIDFGSPLFQAFFDTSAPEMAFPVCIKISRGIDSPYNTGSDAFVYDDNSSIRSEEFSVISGQRDEDGNLLFDMRINNESKEG